MTEVRESETTARPAATSGLRRAHVVAALLGACAAACGDDLPDPPEGVSSSSTTEIPGLTLTGEPASTGTTLASSSSDAGGTSTTDGGPSSVGIPDECTVSADCSEDELCVAPFDPAFGPEGKGAYECVTECVAIMDETRWCADAVACCDPLAACTDRGYCVGPDDSSGGTEDGGTSSGGTTDGTTG